MDKSTDVRDMAGVVFATSAPATLIWRGFLDTDAAIADMNEA